jgi:hypothetical protein
MRVYRWLPSCSWSDARTTVATPCCSSTVCHVVNIFMSGGLLHSVMYVPMRRRGPKISWWRLQEVSVAVR